MNRTSKQAACLLLAASEAVLILCVPIASTAKNNAMESATATIITINVFEFKSFCMSVIYLLLEFLQLAVMISADYRVVSGHIAADLFVPGRACRVPPVDIGDARAAVKAAARRQECS